MNRTPKLGLGTVQWGMDYGIANRAGRTTTVEAGNLIQAAMRHGVTLLDTARAYGEAEKVLGEHGVVSMGLRVVTKTLPVGSGTVNERDAALVAAAFLDSLRWLKCTRVYGLLIHHADNLLAAGGDRLWEILQDFKAQKRVGKIGVSVYRPDQLGTILDRYLIDLVQLPFNLYDQRFVQTGLLGRLKEAGVEIHARGAFLQGLLLFPPAHLPEQFSAIRDHHARLHHRISEAGLTPLAACLGFCLDQADIDRVIVGCETVRQFDEILGVAEQDGARLPAPESYSLSDTSIIDPSTWRQRTN